MDYERKSEEKKKNVKPEKHTETKRNRSRQAERNEKDRYAL